MKINYFWKAIVSAVFMGIVLVLFGLYCGKSDEMKNHENNINQDSSNTENQTADANKTAIADQTGEKAGFPLVGIRDTEKRSLKSGYIDQTFEIDIFLPRSYHSKSKKYPVIYVLDAEYNFGCVSYITRRLIKGKEIPEAIVVGIAYDTDYEDFYLKRARDLTPTHFAPNRFPLSGGAEKFSNFLRDELFPFINNNYRAVEENRVVLGHSFGGLFCFYVLFKQPDLFNRYLIVSPSMWFDNSILFSYEKEYAEEYKNMHAVVYCAAGERETDGIKIQAKNMVEILSLKKYKNLTIKYKLFEDESHRSVPPLAYTKGLRYIFSK